MHILLFYLTPITPSLLLFAQSLGFRSREDKIISFCILFFTETKCNILPDTFQLVVY